MFGFLDARMTGLIVHGTNGSPSNDAFGYKGGSSGHGEGVYDLQPHSLSQFTGESCFTHVMQDGNHGDDAQ